MFYKTLWFDVHSHALCFAPSCEVVFRPDFTIHRVGARARRARHLSEIAATLDILLILRGNTRDPLGAAPCVNETLPAGETIRVDIWSDIACPWCYLGKHRFDAAVRAFREQHPGVAVEVESHSFELAPDTPLDFSGSEIDFLVRHKGMPAAQVEQMLGQMTELGATEDVEFRFPDVKHANTQRAHRVLHLARDRGVQAEVQERLFRAYFAEGENMSDADALARLGAEAGLDADEVRAALDDEAYGEAVQRDIVRARQLGITGVPFFLLDGQYGVSGAQSAEAFANVFDQVLGFQRGDAPAGTV